MSIIDAGLTEEELLSRFQDGALLVYPTEAVFGIGCDPDNKEAIEHLCEIKKRPLSKGLILIADSYSRLLPYVNDNAIPMDRRTEIFSSWPGPVTWLLPKSEITSAHVSGDFQQVAVRVTTHPIVKALCELLQKPLISTSANYSGEPPITSFEHAVKQFGSEAVCVKGETLGRASPSEIKDGFTGKVIRGA